MKREKREKQWWDRERFEHDNKVYRWDNTGAKAKYYRCKFKECPGRLVMKGPEFSILKVTKAHTCQEEPAEVRASEAAVKKLRELTLSKGKGMKAIELVRMVLKDLSPEARSLLPPEKGLVRRITRYARTNNITLSKASPVDYLMEDEEEDEADPNKSAAEGDITIVYDSDPSVSFSKSQNVVVKTGVVCMEDDIDSLDDIEKASAMVFLKTGRVFGYYRAVLEGQSYSWKQSMNGGKLLYACREADEIGCPVTVLVDNVQKTYELMGAHAHMSNQKDKREKTGFGWKTLKKIDDDGNVIGIASLDEFVSGTTEWATDGKSTSDAESIPSGTVPLLSTILVGTEGTNTSIDGDTFPKVSAELDSENSTKGSVVQASPIIASSSQVDKVSSKILPKISKSGERCIVCGDDLVVPETLTESEETFRKACCYLNVKSAKEWFPNGKISKSYSFCESCTNEIIRIHSLYQKVEEIQSQIFKKVECVEKRIADAEIVDNWMAETSHWSALRFAGFRKQVMINYRNKLKLRREIRVSKKMGQNFTEIQPGSSANMYATDPCDTDAFKRIISNPSHGVSNASYLTDNECKTVKRKTRGRPKSKKLADTRDDINSVTLQNANSGPHCHNSKHDIREICNDYQNDYDDSNDGASVTSEKEAKFWVDDPCKLHVPTEVNRCKTRQIDSRYTEHDDLHSDNDESDEDSDWASKKPKKCKKSVQITKNTSEAQQQPPRIRTPKTPKNVVGFPDAILRKDGRVFMEGIEIIKNPPGIYKPRPSAVSFSCGVCGKVITSFWRIRLHICGHHLGLYKCPICQKELTDPRSVKIHISVAHSEKLYEDCPICGKSIRIYKHWSNTMQYHRWTHLSEEEKKDPQYKGWRNSYVKDPSRPTLSTRDPAQTFMCGQCGKQFVFPTALKRHELTHEPGYEVTLMCQYCGKTFNHRKLLWNHASHCSIKAQGKVSLTLYPCPKCPTRFKNRTTRSLHMRKCHRDINKQQVSRIKTTKTTLDPQPSTSVLTDLSTSSQFKFDSTETSLLAEHDQDHVLNTSSQYNPPVAVSALSFNYHFVTGNYTSSIDQTFP